MSALIADLPPALQQGLTFVLVAVAVAALLLALWPQAGRRTRFATRLEVVKGLEAGAKRGAGSDDRRRRVVEDTLREMEAKQKAKARRSKRPTLIGRLRQAGLGWSRGTYLAISAMTGAVAYGLMLAFSGLGLLPAAGFGVAGGLVLPHLYVARRRAKRLKLFGEEFPNALDVIVRGVKAGLPFGDCLRIIAAESQEPVRSEFRTVVHDQTFGIPLDDAVERLAERVPLSQTNFFSIVIAIQSRAGGNLSEALGNLSKVLRDRKQMSAKIKAMSAEAKSSAGIIGAMPVVVAGLLFIVSPDYIGLLFETTAGNMVLVGCGLWMLLGCLVMRKMINFDF